MKKELSKNERIKIKCLLCKEKVPSNAVRCSKCTGDLSTQEAQQDIQKQLHKRKKMQIIAGSLVVFMFLVGILIGSSSEQKITTEPTNTLSSLRLKVGEDGILNNNKEKTNCDGGSILATSKENYDKFSKSLVADDKLGYLGMLGNGELFSVENCTKIKKIGSAFALSEVRILEGEYFGTSGWIAFEFTIKK